MIRAFILCAYHGMITDNSKKDSALAVTDDQMRAFRMSHQLTKAEIRLIVYRVIKSLLRTWSRPVPKEGELATNLEQDERYCSTRNRINNLLALAEFTPSEQLAIMFHDFLCGTQVPNEDIPLLECRAFVQGTIPDLLEVAVDDLYCTQAERQRDNQLLCSLLQALKERSIAHIQKSTFTYLSQEYVELFQAVGVLKKS